jgi:hypothetical protein
MGLRRQQRGMSILGMLAILIMVGFFVMCIIRMAPSYYEFLSVRDIVTRMVNDPETKELSIGSIRRRLETIFHTNQITDADARKMEIYRKKGDVFIDAGYEVRLPIFWRIDAVMVFDDLHYKVGDPTPLNSGDSKDKK